MFKPISHRILTSVANQLEGFSNPISRPEASGLDALRTTLLEHDRPQIDSICEVESFECLEHLSDTLSEEMYFTFPERERYVNFD